MTDLSLDIEKHTGYLVPPHKASETLFRGIAKILGYTPNNSIQFHSELFSTFSLLHFWLYEILLATPDLTY